MILWKELEQKWRLLCLSSTCSSWHSSFDTVIAILVMGRSLLCSVSHFIFSSILQQTATISPPQQGRSVQQSGQITTSIPQGGQASNNFSLHRGSPALTMKPVPSHKVSSTLSDLPNPLNNCYSTVYLFSLLFSISANHCPITPAILNWAAQEC